MAMYIYLSFNSLTGFLKEMETILNRAFCKYDYMTVMGDYNANILKIDTNSKAIKDFCTSFNLTNIIHKPTCFKEKTESLIDIILTNQPKCFLCRNVVNTGISDFYTLIYGVLPGAYEHFKPKYIQFGSFRKFNEEDFMNDIALSPLFNCADDLDINIGMSKYISITHEICDKHASIKTKFINKVQLPITNSKLRKEFTKKSMFQHRINKKRDCVNKELRHVQRNLVISLTRKSICEYIKERCNKNSIQRQRF